MGWRYFSYETDPMLACPCCGVQGMDESFMAKLDKLREDCGFPFVVASGYRCPEYNNSISLTGLRGPHTTGRAVDLRLNSRQRYKLMEASKKLKIYRFGFGVKKNHIDDLTAKDGFPEKVIWSY